MPKVTVLMPVYNGERYLRKAIDSILCQTFQDFDFLIIDDGSRDNTLEIINSYQDQRIKLIQNSQNLGISKALNKGLDLATGKYIARMDCDDISLPERFQKQVDFLDQHPEIIVVGSYMDIIDTQGNKLNQQYQYPLVHDDIVNSMLILNPMGHPSVMFRHFEVLKIGGYRSMDEWKNVSTEDYDLWLRIASKNHELANLAEPLIYYRNHSNSLTQLAFANNTLVDGFNKCFYISGSDVFGCSSEELKLLRERKHYLVIGLFIKIAKNLSKNGKNRFSKRLKDKSFITSMQALTSNKDIISRLVIAYLKEKPLKSLTKEIFLIFIQTLFAIKSSVKKIIQRL